MARASAAAAASLTLGRPPWILAAVLSLAAAVSFAWPSWPGYMSYDSLIAYDQALYGVYSPAWPPMHTYLFVLSRWAHADTWGLLIGQSFVLLFGAALILHVLAARRALAWLLWAGFVGALVWFPTLLGAMMVHWRDVPTGGFAVLGVGLWLAAAQARVLPLTVLGVLMLGVSLALRFNAVVLVLPLMAAMVWRPLATAGAGPGARALIAGAALVSLGLAWGSTQWRLPDLVRLPAADSVGGTQIFDVVGISACSGHNYLPVAATGGRVLTGAQLRTLYDPRAFQLSALPRAGLPGIQGADVSDLWLRLLAREPQCYLAHRSAVFVEQMGMAHDRVHYAVHPYIEPNPYGLTVRDPELSQRVSGYVLDNAPQISRRPALIYPVALVLALAAAWRRPRLALVLGAMMAGALAYTALLFLVGPAADARYIFPSSVLCLLAGLASLGLLATPRRPG